MEEIKLAYGSQDICFNIEGAKSVVYLHENEMNVVSDMKEALIEAMTKGSINSKPLNELINAQDKVTIIISDITRFWMRQDIVCSNVVQYLHQTLGVPCENITILVALGTHRFHTEEEKKKLAGEYAYANVKIVDHDCDAKDFVNVGKTSFGTEVELNPLVASGQKVISIGGTVHHVMAGYGGGRKSILPGVSTRRTIGMNHRLALDPEKAMSDVRVGSGKISENPINLDIAEAATLIDVTFGINIVVDAKGKHSGYFCGNFAEAWKESCRYVQKCYGVPIEYEADIVIASCGGYPKDLNLYQSMKTLFNAARAVKKDGILILVAKCNEGSGSEDFFSWIEPLQRGVLDAELRANFTIGGYIFYAACESIAKANSYLLTDIDAKTVDGMGFDVYNNMDELLSHINFTDKSVYVIEHGGSLMPQLSDDYKFLCSDI